MTSSRLPRSSLNPGLHSAIDTSLKSLRVSLKPIHTLEQALAEEAQVLGRLYYKSKNQHRSALFWRHVGDMKRLCAKLLGQGKSGRAGTCGEALRAAFFESGSTNKGETTLKAQKRQAWTHLPSGKLIASTLHRLYGLSALLNKAESVFFSAFRYSLEQLIQSSTFLPLALTLVAITSRCHALVLEIHNNLESLWSTVQDIAKVLNCAKPVPKSLPGRSSRSPLGLPPPVVHSQSHNASRFPILQADGNVIRPNAPLDEEDIGQSVARSEGVDIAMHPISATSKVLGVTKEKSGPSLLLSSSSSTDAVVLDDIHALDERISRSLSVEIPPSSLLEQGEALSISFASSSIDLDDPALLAQEPTMTTPLKMGSSVLPRLDTRPHQTKSSKEKKVRNPDAFSSIAEKPSTSTTKLAPNPTSVSNSASSLAAPSTSSSVAVPSMKKRPREQDQPEASTGNDESQAMSSATKPIKKMKGDKEKPKKRAKKSSGNEIDAIFGF
ncbi:hypothetical protein DL93DRAFT_2164602 [Clavulina sp. PMI_390]|nr:hypothetical protein DL93DRAFT_2164602 [Clavulina sp. PMI_390]